MQGTAASTQSLADMFEALAHSLEALGIEGMRELARATAEHLRPMLQVDTGRMRDSLRIEETETGATLIIDVPYASYVRPKGASDEPPAYTAQLPRAVQLAFDEVGIPAMIADLTDAYIGQGRTTAHLTGVHRKMTIHTPPRQLQAWRDHFPEMIQTIEITWHGERQLVEVVPSDTTQAGQAGKWTVG